MGWHIFLSNFDLLEDSLNFLPFCVDLFLFNLEMLTKDGDWLFGLFEFVQTIYITYNLSVKLFSVFL